MVDAFGLLGLVLLWLSGKGKSEPATTPPARQLPETTPATPEWPQVTPTGLPPFPGSGWEYDEPPPAAVKQRAGALYAQLWKSGSGTYKIEQTAGRWIAYRAEIIRGGTKGVVAYRQATKRPAAAPASRAPAPRAPAAAAPAAVPRVPAPSPPYTPYQPPGVATPVSMPVPPASVLALPVLRQGDGLKPKPPNPNVRIVQQKLGLQDDGQFGRGTTAGVKTFQKKVGLDPDGVVGPKTWTALFAIR